MSFFNNYNAHFNPKARGGPGLQPPGLGRGRGGPATFGVGPPPSFSFGGGHPQQPNTGESAGINVNPFAAAGSRGGGRGGRGRGQGPAASPILADSPSSFPPPRGPPGQSGILSAPPSSSIPIPVACPTTAILSEPTGVLGAPASAHRAMGEGSFGTMYPPPVFGKPPALFPYPSAHSNAVLPGSGEALLPPHAYSQTADTPIVKEPSRSIEGESIFGEPTQSVSSAPSISLDAAPTSGPPQQQRARPDPSVFPPAVGLSNKSVFGMASATSPRAVAPTPSANRETPSRFGASGSNSATTSVFAGVFHPSVSNTNTSGVVVAPPPPNPSGGSGVGLAAPSAFAASSSFAAPTALAVGKSAFRTPPEGGDGPMRPPVAAARPPGAATSVFGTSVFTGGSSSTNPASRPPGRSTPFDQPHVAAEVLKARQRTAAPLRGPCHTSDAEGEDDEACVCNTDEDAGSLHSDGAEYEYETYEDEEDWGDMEGGDVTAEARLATAGHPLATSGADGLSPSRIAEREARFKRGRSNHHEDGRRGEVSLSQKTPSSFSPPPPPRRLPGDTLTCLSSPVLAQPTLHLPEVCLPPDDRSLCLASRTFVSTLRKLSSPRPEVREEIGEELQQVFFGVVGKCGVHCSFEKTVCELLALWKREKARGNTSTNVLQTMREELWVAVFAIGCQLNFMLSVLTDPAASLSCGHGELAAVALSLRANPIEALGNASVYANQLTDLILELYQRSDEYQTPYALLPLALRRVRTVHDEAAARGVFKAPSNLKTVTSKLFSVLCRKVKASVVQYEDPQHRATSRWLLMYNSVVECNLVMAFAQLVYEMVLSEAPSNDDITRFVEAFHLSFASSLEQRCMLYYSQALLLLQQPLDTTTLHAAADLLARATVCLPEDAPAENRRLLLLKLTSVHLALGRIPSIEDLGLFMVPELTDAVVAVRAANLALIDLAIRRQAEFFVRTGIYSVLLSVRERVSLLMVVRYYLHRRRDSRLNIEEMVKHFGLPYTAMEAAMVWLFPLLVKKLINGVIDHHALVLSSTNPFDEYAVQTLVHAHEAEESCAVAPVL